MFPKAKSLYPWNEDIIETNSSGKLVPNATIVTPTTWGEIPLSSAKEAELSMK